MPCDYSQYPKNWKWLVAQLKKNCGNKCELCYAPNGSFVLRGKSILERQSWYDDCTDYSSEEFRRVKIVLTVHHIDSNKANNSKQNLICLCQKCHLRLDLERHMNNRMRKRAGTGFFGNHNL